MDRCKRDCRNGVDIQCEWYLPWVAQATMASWCQSSERTFKAVKHEDHPTIRKYSPDPIL